MTDDRIPVRFAAAADARPGEALLIEALLIEEPMIGKPGAPAIRFRGESGGHAVGCACCGGRGAAAVALAALFQARALGGVGWFSAVVAVVANPASVAAELCADRLAAARFRVVA